MIEAAWHKTLALVRLYYDTPRKMKITLHSDGMGDATEADFDAWYRFVAARIDDRTGLDVTLEQARFGDGGQDVPRWENDADGDTARDALAVLWEEFCADKGAWPARIYV